VRQLTRRLLFFVSSRVFRGNKTMAREKKDPNLNGGGPHYLIDANSGEIVSKRYDQ